MPGSHPIIAGVPLTVRQRKVGSLRDFSEIPVSEVRSYEVSEFRLK